MQITITLNKDSELSDINAAINMLMAYSGQNLSESAQPAVASNTGNIGLGSPLSPEANVVVGASVTAAEAEPKDAPTVVKRTRKTKEDAAAQAGESANVADSSLESSAQGSGSKEKTIGTDPSVRPANKATEEAAVSTSDSADAAKVPAASFTIDNVRAALQAFTATKGVPEGVALLKKFGAARISELKTEDYAAFVEKCGGAV